MAIMLNGTSSAMRRDASHQEFDASVPETLCRSHVRKLLSSATFARAEQLRRLLSWLGSRSLAPEGLPPTEKEIGETVLGRRDFDPQTDSLVRKEMRRLREKVQQYYSKEGARDQVRLISGGGYLFRFVWSEQTISGIGENSASPCLLVLPIRSPKDLGGQATHLFEDLLVRLGEQGVAQLIAPTTALSYRERVGDIREFARECGADAVVEGSLALDETKLRLSLWFVDGATGRVDRPGRFAASEIHELSRLAASWLHEQALRRG
jgi:TolB-like protein